MIHLFLSYNKMDFDLDFRVFLHEWVCFFCLYPQGGTLELGVVACLYVVVLRRLRQGDCLDKEFETSYENKKMTALTTIYK
jgi:hypothetical protein